MVSSELGVSLRSVRRSIPFERERAEVREMEVRGEWA
jgi:hypothetical protein